MANIVHAHQWDEGNSQYFVSLSPVRDELGLYESVYSNGSYSTSKKSGISDFDTLHCYGYSPVERGLACAGQTNGTVNLTNLLRSELPTLRLRPKQSRPCNSVSFNSNGLMAAGFDKVRNDNCLMVWNIEHYARTSSHSSQGEDSYKTPLESYLPNEVVSSVAFLKDSPSVLLCGSYKFIRELDLRSPSHNYQCASKSSPLISVNPFNDNVFASYSETGAMALWDRRQMRTGFANSEPVLSMNRVLGDKKNAQGSFRFSLVHQNEFATLNEGDLLRRWQIGIVPAMPELGIRRPFYGNTTASSGGGTSGAGGSGTAFSGPEQVPQTPEHGPRSQSYMSTNDTLFISSVLDHKTHYDKVAGFDYAGDATNANAVSFMCIRQSGQVFRMKIKESPDATSFDPQNEIAIVDPERVVLINPSDSARGRASTSSAGQQNDKYHRKQSYASEDMDEDSDGDERRDSRASQTDRKGSYNEQTEEELAIQDQQEGLLDAAAVLDGDISSIIYKRAQAGYAFDCEKNIEILDSLHGDNYLKYVWQWLRSASRAEAKGAMLSKKLDLGFEGVLGIWEGSAGLKGQARHIESGPISEKDFAAAMNEMLAKSTYPAFISHAVAGGPKQAYRRLCLRVAGWNFGLAQLETKLQELEENGQYEKAAGWAVFHGDVDRAVQSLASSNKERLRLISTAVAGYGAYKDSDSNNPWREQCRKLASDLGNPYLRAIFAFIADGSWTDVLDESSLPLVERLGIALRFLPDDELSSFLTRVTARTIRNGDLEGIMLTGITPRAVDLLQSYVDKTSDVQTAALITAFGVPRYFASDKIKAWTEEYRMLLNSWRMFSQRARLDVTRNKLSRNGKGTPMIKPPPRQIYLRCSHCKKTIGGKSTPKEAGIKGKTVAAEASGRCPHCNSPLPRCVICLLPIGSSSPLNKVKGDGVAFSITNQYDQWPTFCLSCNHGLHAGHAKEWFARHDVCPVPDCSCLCNSKSPYKRT